ncbi:MULTISPECIES: thiol reductant ABC exporter subunit CydC [unclassified Cryobacterium]|uniref:thiol reductant ABC exporter subunit CydC n=1 Tax=unclassified Cryobacterium TaxID=2649013 RepID=UPI00106911F5|nr:MULTISPECIES: thiol reductant ABC exporter subunit CydC [unclassified Cryobacterium]TFC53405.1 thiol reductant ABC exporter subunit CydC [Cryobacterium sp. TMB3-1-2]TFC69070.1 thiol reductant ABC exporter subunit CydC [Cryobacterium sp. TMB3-15]TFC76130.1 thiol reductant ABC exporter subunit CydC [Cryobacterium sp. TMB3-10]TFD43865.1 thiol reductant ABC exporter subunit CydC [Cryobacterium sp. TMB3-12]
MSDRRSPFALGVSTATRSVLRLAQPPARRSLPGLAAGVGSAASAVALLACSAWLITRASEMPPILFLGLAVVGVRAFALSRAALRYLERLLSHDAAFRQLGELRLGIFARLLPLAPAGLAGTRRGDLLTRLVRDVDDLQDLPLRVVQPLATSGLVAVLSVVGVWWVLPSAGLTLMVCLIVAGIVGTLATAALSARSERDLAPLRGALADEVLEVVENLDVLTAFGALETRLTELAAVENRLRTASLRSSTGAGVQAAVISLCAGAATVLALIAAIPALGSGGVSGPALAVVVLIPMAVFEVFAMIPPAISAWRQVRSSAERVATAVPETIPAEIPSDVALREASEPTAVVPQTGSPLIELTALGASWPGTDHPALAGVTLRLNAGDRVHLAGASGAGKTTLAQTLVRFLDYTGSYRVNGVEARDLAPAEVRRIVGLCEQRPWLFDDTVRQNLLFARDTATDDDLLDVLARVGLADWVRRRGGLDARVGERGALVSGGQAQRIALARALLADFPVLIVDEPTANVDTGLGDTLVRDILSAAAGAGRAVLLISHTPVPVGLITSTYTLTAGSGLKLDPTPGEALVP